MTAPAPPLPGARPRPWDRLAGYASLFTSVGTLFCCALPSLFVLLGFGAGVASLLSAAPWLVTLSRHKGWVFALSGLVMVAGFVYLYGVAPRLRRRACPPGTGDPCAEVTTASRALLWVSAAVYAAGVFVAYLLGPLLAAPGR